MEHQLESRLSLGQVQAIARDLHHDEGGIAEMFACMKQTDDARVAYNAAWVLSHLSKEDKLLYLAPRYGELVRLATSEMLCFRRALVLSILADLPTGDEPNVELLDYCLAHMTDMKESDSSRSAMIKLAARMCKPYPELCRELRESLEMMPAGMPQSIVAAKRKALKWILK